MYPLFFPSIRDAWKREAPMTASKHQWLTVHFNLDGLGKLTLPETNKSHLKMTGRNYSSFYWNGICSLLSFFEVITVVDWWFSGCLACPAHWFFNFKKKTDCFAKNGEPFRAGKSRGLELAKAMNNETTHGKTREFGFSPQRYFPWKWWAIVTKLKIYDEYIL